MADIAKPKETSHPIEGSSRQPFDLRQMVEAREREKASTQSTLRHQETVKNEEMCRREYELLSPHFQRLKEYIDSENEYEYEATDVYKDYGNILLFKDQTRDSVETLCRSDPSNLQMESLKAIQSLKKELDDFREQIPIAADLAGILDSMGQDKEQSEAPVSKSFFQKGELEAFFGRNEWDDKLKQVEMRRAEISQGAENVQQEQLQMRDVARQQTEYDEHDFGNVHEIKKITKTDIAAARLNINSSPDTTAKLLNLSEMSTYNHRTILKQENSDTFVQTWQELAIQAKNDNNEELKGRMLSIIGLVRGRNAEVQMQF
jgi:hypothetical protein